MTAEDMSRPIQISFPKHCHGNVEGNSRDAQRLAQLTAEASSRAADVQGFPFPPNGTELERPQDREAVVGPAMSERELASWRDAMLSGKRGTRVHQGRTLVSYWTLSRIVLERCGVLFLHLPLHLSLLWAVLLHRLLPIPLQHPRNHQQSVSRSGTGKAPSRWDLTILANSCLQTHGPSKQRHQAPAWHHLQDVLE